jgi:hypothetical protein
MHQLKLGLQHGVFKMRFRSIKRIETTEDKDTFKFVFDDEDYKFLKGVIDDGEWNILDQVLTREAKNFGIKLQQYDSMLAPGVGALSENVLIMKYSK